VAIPCLPEPFGDEVLSSWLGRCAASHCVNYRNFVNGVLRMASKPEVFTSFNRTPDIDAQPPATLLDALVQLTPLSRERLLQMSIVGEVCALPMAFRDAYCPLCLQDDIRFRAVYRRRIWANPWCFVCPTHGCALGEYHEAHDRDLDSLKNVVVRVRLGVWGQPYVTCMPALHPKWGPPRCHAASARRRSDSSYQPEFWLKAEMIESALGRSLLLLCGSRIGRDLHIAAAGFRRLNQRSWDFDVVDGRATLPSLPLSWIWGRLQAAQIAAVFWEALDHAMPVPQDLRSWLEVVAATPVFRARHGRPGATLGLRQWTAALS
jgi:TniQ